MQRRRNPLALFGVLMLALSVTVGMTTSAASADKTVAVAAKKKKKKKKVKPTPVTATVSQTKQVNQAIPDRGALATDKFGALSSTIDIPVTGKAKFVTDVNVTLTTTGSAAGAATDLIARLSAPNGRTFQLFSGLGGGVLQSIGPFKMDDDTATQICDVAAPPCVDPDMTLNRPFAGTAQPPQAALSLFNWAPMKGSWKLTVLDTANTKTNTLVSWAIDVSGRAFPVKK
jgi:subtilisin-like proprotein convertase family protein